MPNLWSSLAHFHVIEKSPKLFHLKEYPFSAYFSNFKATSCFVVDFEGFCRGMGPICSIYGPMKSPIFRINF
jgi:hypothetical protein